MAHAVSTNVSGRTGSARVAPLRPAARDREPADGLSREDESLTGAAQRPNDNAREAPKPQTAEQRKGDRSDQPAQPAEKRSDAEQAAEAERRRADAAKAAKHEPKAAGEVSQEDIKKLEQIRANALYPSPPSAESREIAQRAHTQLIRAEAELKAHELEEAIKKARDQAAAQFFAKQAAGAYRQLEEYDDTASGLIH